MTFTLAFRSSPSISISISPTSSSHLSHLPACSTAARSLPASLHLRPQPRRSHRSRAMNGSYQRGRPAGAEQPSQENTPRIDSLHGNILVSSPRRRKRHIRPDIVRYGSMRSVVKLLIRYDLLRLIDRFHQPVNHFYDQSIHDLN